MSISDLLKSLYDNLVLAVTTCNEFTSALPDCYDAVEAKGGTIPAQETAANLPSAIASIPSPTPQWTGHIDEVGLRAIGWGDSDIAWFKAQIDWNEECDNSMKVPQELIDAYNTYVAEHGAIDSAFCENNKTNWWFRYAPYVSTYNWQALRAAPFMIAFPANYYTSRTSYFLFRCNSVRYMPKMELDTFPSSNYSWSTAFSGTKPRILDIHISQYNSAVNDWCNGCEPEHLKVKIDSATKDLDLSYAATLIKFMDIDAPRVKPITTSAGFTQRCVVCRIKGLAGNLNLNQPYIAKSDLLYIINGEATNSSETAVIKIVNATLYAAYSADADITAALINHPRISLSN